MQKPIRHIISVSVLLLWSSIAWGTPLTVGNNGKELDRMHGMNLYDYTFRQYDPLLCRFTQVDRKCEDYYNVSPYVYCLNNPIVNIDSDGRKVVFVNGFIGFGSPQGGKPYWNGSNSPFVSAAQSTFNDYTTPYFTNYDYNYLESASFVRESLGYKYAKDNYNSLVKDMKSGVDKFNFVSHSMGGAFSEGMMKYLSEQGWEIENAVFLNAWEPSRIQTKMENNRIDATFTNDPVQILSIPLFGRPDIPVSNNKIRMRCDESLIYIHRNFIDQSSDKLWNIINEIISK